MFVHSYGGDSGEQQGRDGAARTPLIAVADVRAARGLVRIFAIVIGGLRS